MIERLTRTATFALYQSSLALGITLMPVALLSRKLGITLPVHRVVEQTEQVYQSVR